MCLILLAHESHPRYPLIVAANRDESHDRPTRRAGWWGDAPEVLAGRDLREGGSWMGVTRAGRWAAVTNFRERVPPRADAPSRGDLVGDYLRGEASPRDYLERLRPRLAEYNGFNLLAGEPGALYWSSNRSDANPPDRLLAPGIYGVSNHLLDTPWPKVRRGKEALAELLGERSLRPDRLLDLLLDQTVAADHELPDTGVGLELERALSTLFIQSPGYGTRSSTALLLDRDGKGLFVERTYRPGTAEWEERRFEL